MYSKLFLIIDTGSCGKLYSSCIVNHLTIEVYSTLTTVKQACLVITLVLFAVALRGDIECQRRDDVITLTLMPAKQS